MDVEEVLTDTNKLSEEAKTAIHKTKIHNGAFQNYTDELVAMLKRIVKKEIANKNNDVQEDDVVMTNKNVFIVYSHQNEYVMFKIKDFIERNLGLCPKKLDISEYAKNDNPPMRVRHILEYIENGEMVGKDVLEYDASTDKWHRVEEECISLS